MADSIHVYLFGKLRQLQPDIPIDADCMVPVVVKEGDTITDVLRSLGIDPNDIAHAFLNHQYSTLTRRVQAGDRLGVFARDMALLYRQYFPKQD